MKRYIVLLLLLSGTVFAQPGEPQKDSLTVQMNQQVQNWMKIYNGGDAVGFTDLYSTDARYISSHVSGLVADGRDNVIKYFQAGMDMGGHLEKVEIISMERSCDLITLLCRYEANNSGEKAIGRNLLVLKRSHDRWLIVLHMTVV